MSEEPAPVRARLGFGPTRDAVIVDALLERIVDVAEAPDELAVAYARQSGWDPRQEPEPYAFVFLRPRQVKAWREANELAGRTLMRDGEWRMWDPRADRPQPHGLLGPRRRVGRGASPGAVAPAGSGPPRLPRLHEVGEVLE